MVSVIIPAYNYGRFIADTIRSLLAQTYPDFEIIIIDNGSTDETQSVLNSFMDPRIKSVRQENKGVSHARNLGLKLSKGKYILFLDADDLVEPDKLKTAVEYFNTHPEIDLVYSDMRYFRDGKPDELFYTYSCDPHAKPWMKQLSGSGVTLVREILQGNIMVICSPVFKSSLIQECGMFNEGLLANEDWDLWMRYIAAGKKIQYLDVPGSRALVRIHKTSLSQDVFKMQVFGLKVLEINKKAILDYGLETEWQKRVNDHVSGIKYTLSRSGKDQFEERITELKRLELLKYISHKEEINRFWFNLKLKLNSLLQ